MTSSLKQVTRIGVYGAVIEDGQILLVVKQWGCDKGLLDLPGGGMEFGETHEEALRREFAEEVAMEFACCRLFGATTYTREIHDDAHHFLFYQIGQLYAVEGCRNIPERVAEEQFGWYPIRELRREQLTSFAAASIRP